MEGLPGDGGGGDIPVEGGEGGEGDEGVQGGEGGEGAEGVEGEDGEDGSDDALTPPAGGDGTDGDDNDVDTPPPGVGGDEPKKDELSTLAMVGWSALGVFIFGGICTLIYMYRTKKPSISSSP